MCCKQTVDCICRQPRNKNIELLSPGYYIVCYYLRPKCGGRVQYLFYLMGTSSACIHEESAHKKVNQVAFLRPSISLNCFTPEGGLPKKAETYLLTGDVVNCYAFAKVLKTFHRKRNYMSLYGS